MKKVIIFCLAIFYANAMQSQTVVLLLEDFESATVGTGGTWTLSYFGTLSTYPYNWFSVQTGGYPITNKTMEVILVTSSTTAFFGYGIPNSANTNFAPLFYKNINAAGYTNLKVTYDWICNASISTSAYGDMMISPSASAPFNFTTPLLSGANTVQHIVNQDISAYDNSTFRLGWSFFVQQTSLVNQPGLSIDNIRVSGEPILTQISTTALLTLNYCTGNNLNVSYTTTGTALNSNIFTAQLSDANGSFSSPVSIGTFVSRTSGTISCSIPQNTPNGTGYRIRVVSSNPVVTGSDNGSDIIISNVPTATIVNGGGVFCGNTSLNATGGSGGTIYFQGTISGGTSISNPSSSQTVSSSGTYFFRSRSVGGCWGQEGSVTVTINQSTTYFADADSDSYGVTNNTQQACAPSGTYTATIGGDCNDTVASIHPGANEICNNGLDDNCNAQIDEGCSHVINLKIFLEGYYGGGGLMNNCLFVNQVPGAVATDVDTLFISAMTATLPSTEVDLQKGILHTDGSVSVAFNSNVLLGNAYYFKVKHRNALETWSSIPVIINSVTTYDFTSAQSQAFGNNMTNVGIQYGESPVWAFYSGDISDASLGVGKQDGIIESQDYSDMENAVYFTLLFYIPEDITGDAIVESQDYGIMENNVYYTIVVIRP